MCSHEMVPNSAVLGLISVKLNSIIRKWFWQFWCRKWCKCRKNNIVVDQGSDGACNHDIKIGNVINTNAISGIIYKLPIVKMHTSVSTAKFSHTQSDGLTSVTAVISYIYTLWVMSPYMTCALNYSYFYIRSVESLALGPLLFAVVLPIIQNVNWKDNASLFIQPDWPLVIQTENCIVLWRFVYPGESQS